MIKTRSGRGSWLTWFTPISAMLIPGIALASGAGPGAASDVHPPFWTILPFVLMLLCIAIIPLFAGHWWEHNRNKGIIAGVLGGCILVYLLAAGPEGSVDRMLVTGFDYIAFISLLTALFIISGGIFLKGTLVGTPAVNTVIMLIGGILASFMGTTGAAMLMVRPLIRANSWRKSQAHVVVFCIFIVANIGGLLTPLGDPPLFLGFLKRVPFEWTFRLAPIWAFAVGLVLVIFFIFDTVMYRKEMAQGSKLPTGEKEPIKLEGGLNFLFLAGIVGAILGAGAVSQNGLIEKWFGFENRLAIDALEKVSQSIVMLAIAAVAMKTTPVAVRKSNNFTWAPIIEVAVLFIGIFITMNPDLWILDVLGSQNRLGISQPWQFFWASGVLSSFLDNAPTYLTFTAAASGLNHTDPNDLSQLIAATTETTHLSAPGVAFLRAVSCGAVFMGANTYIGNGPNFMVKAIAEENHVKMPSFFGYMVYSICFLSPLFVVITFVFFR